jgi:SCY1-like protein 2
MQEDVLLRALKFLDTMLQRNNLEKAGFIKDLASFWERFDARVLTNRVVPPLLGELRTDALSGVVVPLVTAIVKRQSKADFLSITLPALQPIMSSATGETLMHLLRGSDAMVAHMPRATVDATIIPLITRAFDSGIAAVQEEALKKVGQAHSSYVTTKKSQSYVPYVHLFVWM